MAISKKRLKKEKSGERIIWKEMTAEALGCFILIIFGCGVVANVGLAPRLSSAGYDWLAITFGWAIGVILAIYVVGGISGAHINPAVTLALAVKKEFPWRHVLPYIVAQVFGCFMGAFGAYLAYHDGMVAAGMPNIWSTGPGSVFGDAFWGSGGVSGALGQYTLLNSFVTEALGTMILLWGVKAAGDIKNLGLKKNVAPILVGMTVLGIGISLGGPTGYAINPARDLGPRIFGVIAGTEGLFQGAYWFVAPIFGTIVGAIVGIFTYEWFISKPLARKELEEAEAAAQE